MNCNDLFILQKPDLTLDERDLSSPYSIKTRRLKEELLLDQGDRTISSISSNDQWIGLTIEEKNFQWRLDLFDLRSFHRCYRGASFGQSDEIHRGFCLFFHLFFPTR